MSVVNKGLFGDCPYISIKSCESCVWSYMELYTFTEILDEESSDEEGSGDSSGSDSSDSDDDEEKEGEWEYMQGVTY